VKINGIPPSGKLMISVMSAMAEIERENILAQTMAGRKQKALNGGWNGGFAPYGYKLDNGQLVIEDDEAETVRYIFELYTSYPLGANGVAKRLNAEGIKKKVRQNGKLDTLQDTLLNWFLITLYIWVKSPLVAVKRRKSQANEMFTTS
jgi:site-specific DNA recombinase